MRFRKNNNFLMVEIATEFKEGMIFSETKNGKCPNTVLTLKILPCQLTFTRHRILFFWHCSIFHA